MLSLYFPRHKTFLFFIISCLQFIVLSLDLLKFERISRFPIIFNYLDDNSVIWRTVFRNILVLLILFILFLNTFPSSTVVDFLR